MFMLCLPYFLVGIMTILAELTYWKLTEFQVAVIAP